VTDEVSKEAITGSGVADAATPDKALTGFVEQYGGEIVFLRWIGWLIDSAACFGFLVGANRLLGDDVYQKLLPIWISTVAAYFVVLEWRWGRTLGKVLTGMVVVSATGGGLTLTQAFWRTGLRLIELSPVHGGLLAGLVAAASKKKQRIGDMVANTLVVRASDLRRRSQH